MAGATEERYDFVVIGSGPGGYVAAIRAAQLGLKSALVENDRLGGRCLNYACIPAKAVLRSAEILDEVRESKRFGVVAGEPTLDWAMLGKSRDRVIKALTAGVAGLLKKHQVEVIEGTGSLGGAGKVRVETGAGEGRELRAGAIVLATGSVARSIPGVELGERVLDTGAAWLLKAQPKTLAVIGAGASGVEIASAYGRFGSDVVLLEMLDAVLPTEDSEVSELVARELGKQNIEVRTTTAVEQVKASSSSVSIAFGADRREVEVEYLCIATGRAPNTKLLNLEEAGVSTDGDGLVEVDGQMRTNAEGIYAVGDLVPGPALAHKASDEGIIAAEDAAGLETRPIDYINVPRVTFCRPTVASLGLTEAEARERYHDIAVGRMPFGSVGAATLYGDRTGFVKIVGDARLKEIVGAHIVGPKAPELIAELAATRALEGSFEEVARTIHAHPTLSEGVMEAARDADGWVVHN